MAYWFFFTLTATARQPDRESKSIQTQSSAEMSTIFIALNGSHN